MIHALGPFYSHLTLLFCTMASDDIMMAEATKVREWAASKKISIDNIEEVMKLGFDTMEALECLSAADLKKSAIPVGRQKLVLKAVASLSPASGVSTEGLNDETGPINLRGVQQSDGTGTTPGLGNDPLASALLQNLSAQQASLIQQPTPTFNAGIPTQPSSVGQNPQLPINVPLAPVTGNASWQDPQVYLKSLASTKSTCYNIVDFVDVGSSPSEKIVSAGEDIEIVCRSGTKKPKLEHLSLAQWSMANIAILYKLTQDGCLSHDHVFDYLSYTSHVLSLTCSHDLSSVYVYDREYRRLQSLHGFRWGTAVTHLYTGYLRLKPISASSNTVPPKGNFGSTNKWDKFPSKLHFASHTSMGKVICKKFNGKSGCQFNGCRFEHVCNQPGCGQSHSGSQHNDLKNL
jgi:hypothetical protein